MGRLAAFFRRHPALRDALLWAIPAILFGIILRLCLLSYSRFAYWGSDSRSYFDFAQKLFEEHYVSFQEKRRFLYPIFLALVTALPGTPLKWLAWIQHGLGLVTIIPVAYCVRKSLAGWRWFIIPVTILYTGHPVLFWYEHELLGENLFFALIVWSCAGWFAWVSESDRARANRLWWLFLVPFAGFILTKPSGRFFYPGLALGFLIVAGWRRLGLPQLSALAAVLIATFFVGSRPQAAWLLYVSTFPLTNLESPALASYKAEIRDLVEPLHQDLEHYHKNDRATFDFLENPGRHPERPLWAALEKEPKKKPAVYMELAKEAIRAHPIEFLYLGYTRVLYSANLSHFKKERFAPGYFAEHFRDDYDSSNPRVNRNVPSSIPLVLGLRAKTVLPPYQDFISQRLSQRDNHPLSSKFVMAWASLYARLGDLVMLPESGLGDARPTLLGYWLLLSIGFAFAPAYRCTWAPWCLASVGYLCAVFLVSLVSPRYFAPAWPVFIPLLFLPLDYIYRAWRRMKPEPGAGGPR